MLTLFIVYDIYPRHKSIIPSFDTAVKHWINMALSEKLFEGIVKDFPRL